MATGSIAPGGAERSRGLTIRKTRGDVDSQWICGTAAIMAKGQFERINPLNWPLFVCPRQDSNLRHPL